MAAGAARQPGDPHDRWAPEAEDGRHRRAVQRQRRQHHAQSRARVRVPARRARLVAAHRGVCRAGPFGPAGRQSVRGSIPCGHGERRSLCQPHPDDARPPRVPAPGHRRRSGSAAGVLHDRRGSVATRSTRGFAPDWRASFRARCSSIASSAIRLASGRGASAQVSDVELASRLSFFLWSSIPDDRLLTLAAPAGSASRACSTCEVRRLIADRRADALVSNFTGQWLQLRNLESKVRPDLLALPRFRRQHPRGVPPRDRAPVQQHPARAIAASSSCSAPTTRSSTNGWPGTTGFRACTAPASARWR